MNTVHAISELAPPARYDLGEAAVFVWTLANPTARLTRVKRDVLKCLAAGIFLDAADREVLLTRSTRGQPHISVDGQELALSASDCAGVFAVAVARNRRIGVDIEQLRGRDAAETLPWLTAAENTFIRAGGARHEHRFLSIWTQKEALLKGIGLGLSTRFSAVKVDLTDVDDNPIAPAQILFRNAYWQLHRMWLTSRLLLTLAVETDKPSAL